MDSSRINSIEKKYWKGETNLQEEAELKTAVDSGSAEVSSSLISLFANTSQAKDISLDEDFDTLFWQNARQIENKKQARVFTLSIFMRYAAVGIILLGLSGMIWMVLTKENKEEIAQTEYNMVDTYDNPEIAFEETKKALMFASQKLNEGEKPLGEIKRFYNAKISIATNEADANSTKTNNSSK